MGADLNNKLVVGISSRALFDLSKETKIFEEQGIDRYCAYQVAHENDVLKPGVGFSFVKALLELNRIQSDTQKVEVIVMSKNSPDTSLRIFNAIRHYKLDITRSVLTSGAPLAPYLKAFKTDLYLSMCEEDVQAAVNAGVAAGVLCENAAGRQLSMAKRGPIKIAFDADAVIFSDEAERVFQKSGLRAFEESESINAKKPLMEGPFANLLRVISKLQQEFSADEIPIRTALVTARCAPAHERVIRTLRDWGVRVDEAFFLGGLEKKEVLKAFDAHIFFDDQTIHTNAASEVVTAARVPIPMRGREEKETAVVESIRSRFAVV